MIQGSDPGTDNSSLPKSTVSYSISTGVITGEYSSQEMNLTTHFQLLLRLMGGAIPLLLLYAVME